jgi:hypothetical protein
MNTGAMTKNRGLGDVARHVARAHHGKTRVASLGPMGEKGFGAPCVPSKRTMVVSRWTRLRASNDFVI